MSHHWLMNTSFAYNSTIVNNGFRQRRPTPSARIHQPGARNGSSMTPTGAAAWQRLRNAKWLS
jgi:hypothetical protein